MQITDGFLFLKIESKKPKAKKLILKNNIDNVKGLVYLPSFIIFFIVKWNINKNQSNNCIEYNFCKSGKK